MTIDWRGFRRWLKYRHVEQGQPDDSVGLLARFVRQRSPQWPRHATLTEARDALHLAIGDEGDRWDWLLLADGLGRAVDEWRGR